MFKQPRRLLALLKELFLHLTYLVLPGYIDFMLDVIWSIVCRYGGHIIRKILKV